MKRNVTIKANGGDVCLEVAVRIEAHNLTRDEVQACVESAASAVMEQIPSMKFIHTPLARVRVNGI